MTYCGFYVVAQVFFLRYVSWKILREQKPTQIKNLVHLVSFHKNLSTANRLFQSKHLFQPS